MIKKVFLFTTISSILVGAFGFIVIFEGNLNELSKWWSQVSRSNQSLPLSPFQIRHEDSSKMIILEANQIVFEDERLFWKGNGASASPILNKSKVLVGIRIVDGGNGYSNKVTAKIKGAGSENFQLGKVTCKNGRVDHVEVIKSGTWADKPLVYITKEKFPYCGTIETKFPSGQILEESQYLNGLLHGKVKRFNSLGIPVFEKDYIGGRKDGTHIYWYNKPIDPTDYKPVIGSNGDLLPTLWFNILDQAKTKFGKEFGSNEANKWVVKNFKLKGGSFQVKLLEHWKNNLKHGLFEGFDSKSNKTFKDEYRMGHRIKHKTFDKSS